MNYERFYAKKNDSVVVHFPNNKGLDIAEVKTMFSAFGNVLSVSNRNQPYGLCFVTYKTVEEAIKCIEGFRNSSSIKILQHKVKPTFPNKKQKPFKRMKDEISCGSDTDGSVRSKFTSASPFRHSLKFKSSRKATSIISGSSEDTNHNSVSLEEEFNETEIPSLVPIDQNYESHNIKVSTSSTKIIPAQEIIVANIDPTLSIHYVLDLFKKHNPISVSLMMKTPKTGIRYCHVYYKTREEANATMEEFDAYHLRGRSLIVLTPQKLMEEAL